MAHVLGIPLIKGNSNAVLPVRLSDTSLTDNINEGVFVSRVGGEVEPEVADLGEGRLFGVVLDINDCSSRASVVRSAELVLVRTDGTTPTQGNKVLVNASGLVSATGTYTINGEIMSDLVVGKNGKTGEDVADCVLISINSVESDGGSPATSKAKQTAKA